MALGSFGLDLEELQDWKERALQIVRRSRNPARSLQLMRDKAASLFDLQIMRDKVEAFRDPGFAGVSPPPPSMSALDRDSATDPFEEHPVEDEVFVQECCESAELVPGLDKSCLETPDLSMKTKASLVVGSTEIKDSKLLVVPISTMARQVQDFRLQLDSKLLLVPISSTARQVQDFKLQPIIPVLRFIFDPGDLSTIFGDLDVDTRVAQGATSDCRLYLARNGVNSGAWPGHNSKDTEDEFDDTASNPTKARYMDVSEIESDKSVKRKLRLEGKDVEQEKDGDELRAMSTAESYVLADGSVGGTMVIDGKAEGDDLINRKRNGHEDILDADLSRKRAMEPPRSKQVWVVKGYAGKYAPYDTFIGEKRQKVSSVFDRIDENKQTADPAWRGRRDQ